MNRRKNSFKFRNKSFTLVEILIVFAILAILAVIIILYMKPALIFAKSRDVRRVQDLKNINEALNVFAGDNPATAMGSFATAYISLPDSSPTCSSWISQLPPLYGSGGFSYHCAPQSTYTNVDGTGWIPVSFASDTMVALSNLPVDPINKPPYYYVFMTANDPQWELVAFMEASNSAAISDGGKMANAYEIGTNLTFYPYLSLGAWINVPGNSAFGTNNFQVMKYEAKCVQASNNQPLTLPSSWGGYNNSAQPCVNPNYYIASTPNGAPINYITHDTAKSYCLTIGAHLITNDEWMTIADNVASVASNWTGGTVGSGSLYIGNNTANTILQASPDDSQGYYGTNNNANQRRTLFLSNGQVIWDFSGNVEEHVQRSVNNSGDNETTMNVPSCNTGTGWESCEFAPNPNNTSTPYVTAWTTDVPQANVAPPNSSWNSNNGVGVIHTIGSGGAGDQLFVRGGAFNYSPAGDGVFALNLSWYPSLSQMIGGFRCAK
ncbi:MAG: prepilin-type N-terminal cleavage/methylation domain-containing protein [Patescibacteria group bacterium]|nr:prepilin-type N-terminal cleavage/methylation domain-containing protein [Patescibacteria group bacterium]